MKKGFTLAQMATLLVMGGSLLAPIQSPVHAATTGTTVSTVQATQQVQYVTVPRTDSKGIPDFTDPDYTLQRDSSNSRFFHSSKTNWGYIFEVYVVDNKTNRAAYVPLVTPTGAYVYRVGNGNTKDPLHDMWSSQDYQTGGIYFTSGYESIAKQYGLPDLSGNISVKAKYTYKPVSNNSTTTAPVSSSTASINASTLVSAPTQTQTYAGVITEQPFLSDPIAKKLVYNLTLDGGNVLKVYTTGTLNNLENYEGHKVQVTIQTQPYPYNSIYPVVSFVPPIVAGTTGNVTTNGTTGSAKSVTTSTAASTVPTPSTSSTVTSPSVTGTATNGTSSSTKPVVTPTTNQTASIVPTLSTFSKTGTQTSPVNTSTTELGSMNPTSPFFVETSSVYGNLTAKSQNGNIVVQTAWTQLVPQGTVTISRYILNADGCTQYDKTVQTNINQSDVQAGKTYSYVAKFYQGSKFLDAAVVNVPYNKDSLATNVTVIPTFTAIPLNVQTSVQGNTTLTWNKDARIDYYQIQRSTNGKVTLNQTVFDTNFVDNAPVGTNQYLITAYIGTKPVGTGLSNSISVATQQTPPVQTNLGLQTTLTSYGYGGYKIVNLSFGGLANATRYVLTRLDENGTTVKLLDASTPLYSQLPRTAMDQNPPKGKALTYDLQAFQGQTLIGEQKIQYTVPQY